MRAFYNIAAVFLMSVTATVIEWKVDWFPVVLKEVLSYLLFPGSFVWLAVIWRAFGNDPSSVLDISLIAGVNTVFWSVVVFGIRAILMTRRSGSPG